jgi:hypothetical protein
MTGKRHSNLDEHHGGGFQAVVGDTTEKAILVCPSGLPYVVDAFFCCSIHVLIL